MAMTAEIKTASGEIWHCPVTLKVIVDWERWSGNTINHFGNPTAIDMGFICWRSAIYSKRIRRTYRFDKFLQMVTGWDIVNLDSNIGDEIEEWLNKDDQ